MESVKKSTDERALHKREYDRRVNERYMQTKEGKVDTSKSLDASLVDTENSGIEFEKQYISNMLGNDADADDADIRPIYDEEPMAEVYQNAEQCHNIRPLSSHLTDNQTDELSNQSLKFENIWKQGQFLKAKSNEAKVKKNIDDFETINIELEYSVTTLIKENEHLKKTYKDLYDSIKKTLVQTKDHNDSLIAQLNKKSIENADLKA
ncbi:hypothetical protein Tco_0679170 [Tanacetum coccineum]|uniref:Uncharacterized protein n=1 Tax=Tanacetum coccineum TaxID=301880 RepID=A0ABQ4XIF4_9ASTR